jgi:multidrug efflux pump subunit AcrA (membrane-fusion protein)
MSVAIGRGRVDIDGGLIQIAAQRDGVVVEVFVEEGANVKAGQLLARLDDRVPLSTKRVRRWRKARKIWMCSQRA